MTKTTDTRPLVSDVVRETGVTASELLAVAPELNVHTAKAVVGGRKPGTTQAALFAIALRRLANVRAGNVDALVAAAETLDTAYPNLAPPDEEKPEELDRLIIYLAKRKKSFASIGRIVGRTRQAIHQRVEAHEQRTGETIPRCGTDY